MHGVGLRLRLIQATRLRDKGRQTPGVAERSIEVAIVDRSPAHADHGRGETLGPLQGLVQRPVLQQPEDQYAAESIASADGIDHRLIRHGFNRVIPAGGITGDCAASTQGDDQQLQLAALLKLPGTLLQAVTLGNQQAEFILVQLRRTRGVQSSQNLVSGIPGRA